MTPAKTRMQRSRDHAKAQGKKRVTLTLTPDAAAALDALKAAGYGADYNTVVSRALLALAVSKVAPALVDNQP